MAGIEFEPRVRRSGQVEVLEKWNKSVESKNGRMQNLDRKLLLGLRRIKKCQSSVRKTISPLFKNK